MSAPEAHAREGTPEAESGAEVFEAGRRKRVRDSSDSDADFVASDSDADSGASDSDADSGADYVAPPKKTARKKRTRKKTARKKPRVVVDPANLDVFPEAAKVRETVLERARAHGHTVREVDGEHVIVHLACILSTSAVEHVVRAAVRETPISPEPRCALRLENSVRMDKLFSDCRSSQNRIFLLHSFH